MLFYILRQPKELIPGTSSEITFSVQNNSDNQKKGSLKIKIGDYIPMFGPYTFKPYERKEITVNLEIPENMKAGEYDILIDFIEE